MAAILCQEAAEIAATPNPYGSLGKLPKELRDNVYAVVVASGSTALTMTSQALNEDTKAMLHRYGICRLTIDPYSSGVFAKSAYEYEVANSQRVLQFSLAGIQNLELDFAYPLVELGSDGRHCVIAKSWDFVLRDLISSMDKPKHCHAVFTGGSYELFTEQTPDAVRSLRAFESVTVELHNFPVVRDSYYHDGIWRSKEVPDIVKTIARLLGQGEDKGTAPGLTIVWHGTDHHGCERRMTLFPPIAISLG